MSYGVTFQYWSPDLMVPKVFAKLCYPLEIRVSVGQEINGYINQVSVEAEDRHALRAKLLQFSAVLDKEIQTITTDLEHSQSVLVSLNKSVIASHQAIIKKVKLEVDKYIERHDLWQEDEPKKSEVQKPVVVKVYKVQI